MERTVLGTFREKSLIARTAEIWMFFAMRQVSNAMMVGVQMDALQTSTIRWRYGTFGYVFGLVGPEDLKARGVRDRFWTEPVASGADAVS